MINVPPRLITKMKDVVEELEDTLASIDLGFTAHEELKKLEEAAGKYARKAPTLDIDKLCEDA